MLRRCSYEFCVCWICGELLSNKTFGQKFLFFSLSRYLMAFSTYLFGFSHEPAHMNIIYNTNYVRNTSPSYQSAMATAIAPPNTAKDSLHGIRNEPAPPTPLSTVSVGLPSICACTFCADAPMTFPGE